MTGRSPPEPHARYSGYVGTGEKTSVPRADVRCNCGSSIVYKFRGYRQLLFYSDSLFFLFVLLYLSFFLVFFLLLLLCASPTILDVKTNDNNDDDDDDGAETATVHGTRKKVIIKPNCAYNGIALENTAHNKIRTRARPRQREVYSEQIE